MKALVYTDTATLEYQDFKDPIPAKDEELIRIAHVGICGSDMHAFLGHDERRPAPLILGHEASGIIVGGKNDGQRVTVNPLVTCQECVACHEGHENLCAKRQIISMPPREGAFAEFVAIPRRNLVNVPDGFSLAKASLAEPLACGWHAIKLVKNAIGDRLKTSRALVQGGGAIGVAAALSLKAQGVEDVSLIELNTERCDYLRSHLNVQYISPEKARNAPTFDVIIDGVGFDATRKLASEVAKPGGVIAHIGLGSAEGGLDIRRMTLQEITFIGSYTYSAQDFRDTAQAMFEGHMGELDWFETQPLKDGQDAFNDLKSGKIFVPKIILNP